MTTPWSNFELPKLPTGVKTAVSSFTSVLDTLTSVLSILKGLLQVLSAMEVANLSTAQLAVKTATSAIESAIQSLIKDAGVYVLFVPPRKKLVLSPVVDAALKRVGVSLKEFLASAQAAGLDVDLAGSDEELRKFFNEIAGASGGNAGFLKTVFESLEDGGDPNRPQLGPGDALFGACIVAGSSDYIQLLNFLASFKAIFGAGRPGADMEIPGLPVPAGVRARTTANGVFVEWNYQPGLIEVPSLSQAVAIKKAAVIRSNSPLFVSQTHVLSVFGKTDLKKGDMVGIPNGEYVEVVDVIEDLSNGNIKHDYLDTDATDKIPYYYAVSYHWTTGTTLELLTGKGTALGFQQLSNIAKAVPSEDPAATRSSGGTPPDWLRTKNIPSLIPDLGKLLARLETAVTQFGNVATGYGDMLKTYIKYIEGEIAKYEEMAEELGGTVQRLASLFDTDMNVGVYVKPIDGTGGTEFLKRDLAAGFAPGNPDPKRPPFDRGDEFVGGMIMLVAAPTAAGLAPAKELLGQLLFDQQNVGTVVANALAQIDTVLEEAEQKFFGDNFEPAPEVHEAAPAGPPALGEADPGNCAKPPAGVEFGDDFKPKE